MSLLKSLLVFSILCAILFFASIDAARFDIQNNCAYTVWAAAVPSLRCGTKEARIWGRTGCHFDGAGRDQCQTGDCGGVLQCRGYGQPPNTLAEYALNQHKNLDFFDLSLVDGFNVPMVFSPTSGGCTKGIRCMADIKGQCPNQLRARGGCNNPCTVFKSDKYCCNSGNYGPTDFSKYFKSRCPDAYSYLKDDQTSTFTCPGGPNYMLDDCQVAYLDDDTCTSCNS